MEQKHTYSDNVAVFADMLRYFADSRYIRIQQKPIILIYRPAIIPEFAGLVESWRVAARRAGLRGIYIVATNAFGFDNREGFDIDGICEFPPHGLVAENTRDQTDLLNDKFNGEIYEYNHASSFSTERLKSMTHTDGGYFPTVMCAWDNEARKPGRGHVFNNATPLLFYDWLQTTCEWSKLNNKSDANFVFVNAWNEWGEGTYLEPDRRFGYA